MPVIKSAKKRARQSIRRRGRNLRTLKALREGRLELKSQLEAKSQPKTDAALKTYQSALDKAVKKNVMSKARAARLLSAAMRQAGPPAASAKKKAAPAKKPAAKTTPAKKPAATKKSPTAKKPTLAKKAPARKPAKK